MALVIGGLEIGACPKCGQKNIHIHESTTTPKAVMADIECKSCGHRKALPK